MRFKIILFIITCMIIFIPNLVFTQDIQWFTSSKEINNTLQTGKVDVSINKSIDDEIINLDIFSSDKSKIESKINFINTGTSDIFLRILVIPTVTDYTDKTWVGKVDTDEIEINYFNASNKLSADDKYWYIGEDGYMYYKSVIKKDEQINEKFLESISINLSEKSKEYYKDKNLNLKIVVEAVQSKNQAYKSVWSITDEELIKILDKQSLL